MRFFDLTRKSGSVLLRNAAALARVTFPAFCLYAVAQAISQLGLVGELSVQGAYTVEISEAPSAVPPSALQGYVGLAALVIFGAFMAVQVHRLVLLDDPSARNAIPPKIFGAYIWRGFTLLLVGVAIILVISFVSVPILIDSMSTEQPGDAPPMPWWFLPATTGISLIVFAFVLRISLGLPGAAVGRPMGLGESFEFTRGHFLGILAAIFVGQAVWTLVTELIAVAVPKGLLGWGLQTLASWPFLLYNALVLTVLYGHRVEGRPLRG